MLQIILFVFYLVLFSIAIISIPFFKNAGIGKVTLIGIFAIKVCAGFAYANFFLLPQYYEGADTWRFYRQSLVETKWLLNNPAAFIKDLFIYGYNNSGNLFSGENSYWNDLKSNVVVKIISIINVLTNNSYWICILFFNFLFLFGLVALIKLLVEIFQGKKWIIITSIILLPSTLFWSSGIHKDGLILSATGIVIYLFHLMLKKRLTLPKALVAILCLLLIFSLRNYILFALIPGLISWYIASRFSGKVVIIFLSVYVIGISLFFLVPLISPSLNFPLFITQKQFEFLLLEGGSKVHVKVLEPKFTSFLSFFPQAIDMAFLRPHINEIKNFSYIPAVIEIFLLLIMLVFCLFKMNVKASIKPEVLFFVFFAISILLIAGYTIPFTSAIVRYRSFAWPFLITPLVCLSLPTRE